MKDMALWSKVAWFLVVIGAINWGLIGLFGLDIVALIFGASIIARLIYILIGVAGGLFIYLAYQNKKITPAL